MTRHNRIVLEHEPNGTVSAYVVGLPGVFAAADTERAAGAAIRKAVRAHLGALLGRRRSAKKAGAATRSHRRGRD